MICKTGILLRKHVWAKTIGLDALILVAQRDFSDCVYLGIPMADPSLEQGSRALI